MEMQKLFNMRYFFTILESTDHSIVFKLKKPSIMLMKNIHLNWLQYVYTKTHKQIPVYRNELKNKINPPSIYGIVEHNVPEYHENTKLEHSFCNNTIKKAELQLKLVVPQQDTMQYFIKWQRYRKYWWSSISTTPSLFSVNDIRYEDNTATADIVANFACGQQPVETVTIQSQEQNNSSHLVCKMSLEQASLILLLDGLTNGTQEEYLRLHRKIAPYKISFAMITEDSNNKASMRDLATLLHHKLNSHRISSWLPQFCLPYEEQIKENLHMGVTYSAVFNDNTLKNGIFKLLNSSTMLGEEVHVADFDKYAAILFNK